MTPSRGGHGRGHSRRGAGGSPRRYARTSRVNEVLREVVADELERISDTDERLRMLTVTGVECDPDLRHAEVLFSSLDAGVDEALAGARVRLQAAVSQQVRLKRTPQLTFAADPAVAAGQRIDDILRQIPRPPDVEGEAEAGGEERRGEVGER